MIDHRDIKQIQAEREKQFVACFARTLHSMLCPTSAPQNMRDFEVDYVAGDDPVLKYAVSSKDDSSIDISCGDRFVLEILQPDGKMEWEKPVLEGESIQMCMGASGFEFQGVNPGQSTILLRENVSPSAEDRAPELIQVRIEVHSAVISPELQAIFRCCIGGSDLATTSTSTSSAAPVTKPLQVRAPTLHQLSCHPYFCPQKQMDDEENRVMNEFERIECQM